MGKVPAPIQTDSKVNKSDQQQQSDLCASVHVSVDLSHAEVMPLLYNVLNDSGQRQIS